MLRDSIGVASLTTASFIWIEFFLWVLFWLIMGAWISFSIKKMRNERNKRKMNVWHNT